MVQLMDVPPSTLAAALIKNLGKENTSSQLGTSDKAVLQELLAEFLPQPSDGTGRDGEQGKTSAATGRALDNEDINATLVQTIISFGLCQDDVFLPFETQVSLARDCLVVVQLTIQRTPKLLIRTLHTSKLDGKQQNRDESMHIWLWLYQKLLPLVCQGKWQAVQQGLVDTLEVVTLELGRLTIGWRHLRLALAYLEYCVEGVLMAFKTDVKATMKRKFSLDLPMIGFHNLYTSSSESMIVSSLQLGFTLDSSANAFSLAVQIVRLIARVGLEKSVTLSTRLYRDHTFKALNSLSQLVHFLSIWCAVATKSRSATQLYKEIIDTVIDVVEHDQDCFRDAPYDMFPKLGVLSTQIILLRKVAEVDQDTEISMSKLLLLLQFAAQTYRGIHLELSEILLPLVKSLMQDLIAWPLRHRDLKVSLLKLAMNCSDDYAFHQIINTNVQLITGNAWQFQNATLQTLHDRLAPLPASTRLSSVDMTDENGPRKRRKTESIQLASNNTLDSRKACISMLYRRLGGQNIADLAGLENIAAEGFAKLSVSARCSAMTDIGTLTCLIEDGVIPSAKSSKTPSAHVPCIVCDKNASLGRPLNQNRAPEELVRILETIQKTEAFGHSSEVRLVGMKTLQKFVKHGSQVLDGPVSTSVLGHWCLHSLRSRCKDLRMLAAIILPRFTIFTKSDETSRAERANCLDFLRKVSMKSPETMQETCVIAWGRLARVLEEEELALALIRLVDYLSHSNAYLAAVAYNEIEGVAQAKNMAMTLLLGQFWRSLSVGIVQQLRTRPQVAQNIASLLGIPVQDYLHNTITYTLPYMILMKKQDVMESLTQAYNKCHKGANYSLFKICMQNITSILGILLVQDVEDVSEDTMKHLRNTDESFRRLELSELIKSDPIAIMAETLKAYAELDEERKSTAQKAIQQIAVAVHKKPPHSRKEKQVDILQFFFEGHVLGIITQYADVLFSTRVKYSTMEKRRNIRAIEEMIHLGKAGITSGLPQISACLQAALEMDALRSAALRSWAAMVNEIPSDDVLTYICPTFSLLLKYWDKLDEQSRSSGVSMVSSIFEKHTLLLKENANTLPSLARISAFAGYEKKLSKWKTTDLKDKLRLLASRCSHENPVVVEEALLELRKFLNNNESFVQSITNDEIPDTVIAEVIRYLIDTCVKYNHSQYRIGQLSAECLGTIGAVDPNRVDASRKSTDLLVLHNFEKTDESIAFAVFLMENRLVKAFLSATDTRAQGFLSFAMQELLKFCSFSSDVLVRQNVEMSLVVNQTRWNSFSATAKGVLAPFLSSKYVLSTAATTHKSTYPIFSPVKTYREWLTEILLDLLPKASGVHTKALFGEICSKIVKGQDLAILNFILPFIVLHITISGSQEDNENICTELLSILNYQMSPDRRAESEMVKRCSESVFTLIDHMSKWIREKRRYNSQLQMTIARQQLSRHPSDIVGNIDDPMIAKVELLLSQLPANLIGERSVQCQSYARALFYWEQHMRRCRSEKLDIEPLYAQMQSIYAEIDEPDGIEGISTKLNVVNINHQILEDKKAGRWLAVQSWYEHLLRDKPDDVDLQSGLLSSLKESGQHENLLVQIDPILKEQKPLSSHVLRFGIEAAWSSFDWEKLEIFLKKCPVSAESSFDICIGRAIQSFRMGNSLSLSEAIKNARDQLSRSLTFSGTNSIRSCSEILFQFHVLSECEYITTTLQDSSLDFMAFKQIMDGRLNLLGPSHREKQYILALRRALVVSSPNKGDFVKPYVSSLWLTTSKLARKKKDYHRALTAILKSSDDQNAPTEQARLAWDEGRHRQAIKILESAIAANRFTTTIITTNSFQDTDMSGVQKKHPQSSAKARAMLLWARWMDSAGHIQSKALALKFSDVTITCSHWEKGHYYLGRHYNNILKTEKSFPLPKRPQASLIGETTKLVCINYLKAMTFGTKYIFQTLPLFLTLWLDFGVEYESPFDDQIGTAEFRAHLAPQRQVQMKELQLAIKKYCYKSIPVYVYLTALPQIMSRVGLQSEATWSYLENIIMRILFTYPRHTMWSILAVFKSVQADRRNRAARILSKLKLEQSRDIDLKTFIIAAQKLVQELLNLSNFEIKTKLSHVNLRDDLGFQHSVAPIAMIIPVQSALTVSFPADGITPKSQHNPFSRDQATIAKFEDVADVMPSLQKPRKITVIGTDGRRYPLLCKPKDDLRKDARLIEFNTIINRLLKKDDESSRRQLLIRTYAVTPLNEECGIIEWVNHVRALRDIILKSYKHKNVNVNYTEVRALLDEGCSDASKTYIFTDVIVPKFPSVFHEWFVESFPEPEAWFAARLAYIRTSAVMSMVGHVLGLGDRHGENITFDETTGMTLHVDFNCLFEKGLTFDKPERVPFRLTQNMVDAMGLTGYEGPFRRTSEVVMRILRSNEESLMTVLETFLHDPLVEWMGIKKRRSAMASRVPDNPRDVLENIQNKLRGLHAGDPIPLSVEGQVQELIQQAVNPENLVNMYIGWCSFF